ncbi:MAG: hypothetical protein Q7S34_00380, partial [bacterium]|nr:hypothetical protein [bacterium]
QNPPFKSGDIVKAKSDQSVHSDNRSAHYYRFNLPADKTQKIGRVHYAGSGKWQLSFNGIKDSEGWNPRFSADSFCLAPAEVLVSSS